MDKSSFASAINSANSVLILLPTNPYFDQVASGLALYLALSKIKDVTISAPSDMTVEFNRLVGVNKVKKDLGNKNLVVRFENYDGKSIERVSADDDNGVFTLTVVPKPRSSAPSTENVKLSYANSASDTVILVGGANESHFPWLSANELANANLLHVGVKDLSLSPEKSVLSISDNVSSVSEVVARQIFEVGNFDLQGQSILMEAFPLDADIATNLLMGIEVNTKGFTSNLVSADTFMVVSHLMKQGGKRNEVTVDKSTLPPGSIPQPKNYNQTSQVNKKSEVSNPPKDWLTKPRIYKGASLS